VERLWSRLGSWIMNRRTITVKDAMDIVSTMVFEANAKYGLFNVDRVGYVRRGEC